MSGRNFEHVTVTYEPDPPHGGPECYRVEAYDVNGDWMERLCNRWFDEGVNYFTLDGLAEFMRDGLPSMTNERIDR